MLVLVEGDETGSVIINISSCEDVSVRVSDSAGAQASLLRPDVKYFQRRNHFKLFTARPEQTYIASSSGVFIGLIMSNKRGELYFIDNFRLSSTDTETKNYKTSSK